MAGPTKRKDLGQHFLREPRIARRIIEAAEIERHHRVLEVGPGAGVLTTLLCDAAAEVVAVEADPRFAALLGEAPADNLTLVEGDALKVDLESLGPFDRIVANLPYQISGPITFRFLELAGWSRAVLMYQKEFADRLLAGPGTKAYGRISVHTAREVAVSKVRDVPPGCFDPPPKVQSTVVRLDRHETPPFVVSDERLWRAVVDGSFQQRRKQLRNTVPAAVASFGLRDAAEESLASLQWSQRRPEEIAPAEFAALVAMLT